MESCARYSASAASQTQKFLRIAFKDAICDGYIKTNQMEYDGKYWTNISRVQILTKEEIKIFLAAASQNQTLYLEVLLALFCGLRKGEILGLQFTDLNVKERTLHVQRQMTRNYHVNFRKRMLLASTLSNPLSRQRVQTVTVLSEKYQRLSLPNCKSGLN